MRDFVSSVINSRRLGSDIIDVTVLCSEKHES